jgi:L-histidine N-alpha-methyltransferase
VKSAIEAKILAGRTGEWETVVGTGFRLYVDLEEDAESTFAGSVLRTLSDSPRWLHCRWLYDETGSELYERITEQPEYYLTRLEDRILADNAAEMRRIARHPTIVELGSGSSTKTRHILEAWLTEGASRYVPIDISRSVIEHACTELSRRYPGLGVEGLAARYARALPLISSVSPLLLVFLGSTIGNFNDAELDEFLVLVAASLECGDKCLLGIDLVKEPAALDAAYNDAAGWTERFMVNAVERMNRELGSEIPLGEVEYDGFYNEKLERVEMYLRFTADVQVPVPGVAAPISIVTGESVMIEISRKFRVEQMLAKIRDFGFHLERQFTDPDELFAVLRLTRAA